MIINYNNNGCLFQKDDKIVCIEDMGWNDLSAHDFILKKNMVFTVLDTIIFKGVQSIDIGARFYDKTKRTKQFLSSESIPGDGIHWASSFRFKKINEDEVNYYENLLKDDLIDCISKAVGDEEFELAVKFRDILNGISNQ